MGLLYQPVGLHSFAPIGYSNCCISYAAASYGLMLIIYFFLLYIFWVFFQINLAHSQCDFQSSKNCRSLCDLQQKATFIFNSFKNRQYVRIIKLVEVRKLFPECIVRHASAEQLTLKITTAAAVGLIVVVNYTKLIAILVAIFYIVVATRLGVITSPSDSHRIKLICY